MATGVTAKFTIHGDVKGAVKATTEFGKAITSLNRRLTAFSKKSAEISAFTRVLEQMNRTITSFTRRANSAAQAADRLATSLGNLNSQMATGAAATTGGIGPGMRGPQAVNMPDVKQIQEVAQAARSETTAVSGLMSVISSVGSKATLALTALKIGLDAVGKVTGKVRDMWRGFTGSIGNFLTSLPQAFNVFQRFLMNFTDGLRLITLGVTNMARSIMFFISIPLIGVLYRVGQAVIDFDDGMKRVQKTTGMLTPDVEKLALEIRELAKYTATSHGELVKMAEDAGQLGLKNKEAIMSMVEMGNMLAVATDITTDEVVETLGRIANAFQWNVDASTDEIWRLINVINMLENETETSAAEIVEAMFQFAPIGDLISISAADVAALGATLVSMGYDASKSGTALRNIGIYMVKNIDLVEQLMSAYDKYAEKGAVAKAMNEDFITVLMDFLWLASGEEDIVAKLSAEFEALNLRGGRGAASFTENLEDLIKNLGIARGEWKQATSILAEYDRAMSSTKSQMAVLRNNFVELGITIGDVVLPVLNKLIQFLIPLVQMAAAAFKALDRRTQLLVVAFIALVVVGGPLMMFLAQLVHGLFLIGMGFATLLRLIPTLITVFLGLGKVGFALIGIFSGWRMALIAGFIGILVILQKRGYDIAGFFKDLADRATAWGENLAAQYGEGLIAGAARYIAAAISWIATIISNFLAAFSPPKKGPLSQIKVWGKNLIQEYLKGFKLADFQILADVGRVIEGIFKNWAALGRIAEDAAVKFALKARENLAKLIKIWSETGEVSESVLRSVLKNLGKAADEVEDLIRAWFDYLEVQKRLKEIERLREDVLKTYEDEVKAIMTSDMSATQKVAALRDAMRARNGELKALDEEEDLLKEQEDLLKEQLSWQQEYIRALMAQEDLQIRLIQTLERMAKAAQAMADAASDYAFPDPGDAPSWEIDEETRKTLEAFYNLPQRIEDARLALQGFFAGLRGEKPFEGTFWAVLSGLDPEVYEDYMALYNVGTMIRDVWLQIQGIIGGLTGVHMTPEEFGILTPEQQERYENMYNLGVNIRGIFDLVAGVIGRAWEQLDKFLGRGEEGGKVDWGERIKKTIGDIFKLIFKIPKLGGFLEKFFPQSTRHLGEFFKSVKRLWRALGPFIGMLFRFVKLMLGLAGIDAGEMEDFGDVWEWLGDSLGKVVDFFVWMGKSVLNVLAWILELGTAIGNFFMDLLEGKDFSEAWANLIEALGPLGEKISEFFGGLWEWVKEDVLAAGAEIIANFIDKMLVDLPQKWEEFKTAWGTKIGEWITGLEDWYEDLKERGRQFVENIKAGLTEKWQEFVDRVNEKVEEIRQAIEDFEQDFKDTAAGLLSKLIVGFLDFVTWLLFKSDVSGKISEVKAKIDGWWEKFKKAGSDLAAGLKSGFLAKIEELIDEAERKLQKFLNRVKDILGVEHSPSEITKVFGRDVVLGLIKGIQQMDTELSRVMGGMLGGGAWSTFAFSGVRGAPRMPRAPYPKPAVGLGGRVEININDPVVREEEDLQRLADLIEKRINERLFTSTRFGGNLL